MTESMGGALVRAHEAPSLLSPEQIDLLKRTVAKGTTDDEFALFVNTAARRGLDPFARQIHAVKRWDRRENREVMAIQVAIDGYRLIAQRTGEYDGQDARLWCGADMVWRDVWLEAAPPRAAKATVWRKGCARPFVAVARWESYVQHTKDQRPTPMWERMPDIMLGKCAEALALRMAFPEELSGTHTPEELGEDEAERVAFGALPARPQGAAAHPSAPAAQGSGQTRGAAVPPGLSEDDVIELITAIGSTTSPRELRAVGDRIRAAHPSEEQRGRLLKAFADHEALLRESALAEAGGSKPGAP